MVGELEAQFAGRQVKILLLRDHAVVRFPNYRTAFAVLKFAKSRSASLEKLLTWARTGLKLQVGSRTPIDFYPQPGRMVRWLTRLV